MPEPLEASTSTVVLNAIHEAKASAKETAALSVKLEYIEKSLQEIKDKLDSKYVPFEVFTPAFQTLLASDKDKELRVRKLELWSAMGIGALFILQIVLEFFIR